MHLQQKLCKQSKVVTASRIISLQILHVIASKAVNYFLISTFLKIKIKLIMKK